MSRIVIVSIDDPYVVEVYVRQAGAVTGPQPVVRHTYPLPVPPDDQLTRDVEDGTLSLLWEAAHERLLADKTSGEPARQRRHRADVLEATAKRLRAAYGLDEEEA